MFPKPLNDRSSLDFSIHCNRSSTDQPKQVKVGNVAVIFPRWTNWIPAIVVVGLLTGGPATVFAVWYWFSPAYTDVGYAPEQPVPFSHKLHAGELGLDCRYCHYTVEKSPKAAIPPTSVCMGCHLLVQPTSPRLRIVRDSAKTGTPIPWVRVHLAPDYAFFDHRAHVAAGVGCQSCHGSVDQMTVVRQVQPLSMSWCLDCHRDPNPHLRPRSEVTNMKWIGSNAQKDYIPWQDPERTKRADIQRLRKDLQKEANLARHTHKTDHGHGTDAKKAQHAGHDTHDKAGPEGFVRMAGKSNKPLTQQQIERIVVNPPEHCSGCHR